MEQYVILPKKENGELLQKYEILIYVCIRRYMNAKTMKAFPSLDTIAKDSGCSKPTILKTIKEIVRKGYIEIENKPGLGNTYKFNNEKSFEPFSYEFLDNPKLTKSEKLQILCTQQFMYKDNGIGKLSYTNAELAELTGLDRHTISKNNNSLISKNFMTQVALKSKNAETGLIDKETIYHLNELGQAIVFAITNHEERIQQNTEDISTLKQQMTEMQQKYTKNTELLLSEIHRLQDERDEALGKTKSINVPL